MKVIKQNGETVECIKVQIDGNEITYTPVRNRNEKLLCGVYKNNVRAAEVFSDIAISVWGGDKEYMMPIS